MIGYAATVVLFWIGVVALTLSGCWYVEHLAAFVSRCLERRRVYLNRAPAPAPRIRGRL